MTPRKKAPRPLDAARQEVIESALSYSRCLREAMVDPSSKARWNAAHTRLLAAVDRLEQAKATKPEPIAC